MKLFELAKEFPIKIGNKHFQVEGVLRTMSDDPIDMAQYKAAAKYFFDNYRPGMRFNAAPEIEISSADKINQGYLAQFIIEQLMQKYVDYR